MLAPKFVSMEIQEWVDSHPGIDKLTKEVLIEFAERVIASYEFYKKEVSGKQFE